MRDHLAKMPDDKSTTATREELIKNIGYEPDEIQDSGGFLKCENWIWKLKGGSVEMLVCPHEGKWVAHNKAFLPKQKTE